MLKIIIDYFNSQWGTISNVPSFFLVTIIIGFTLGWLANSLILKNQLIVLKEKDNLKNEDLKRKDSQIKDKEDEISKLQAIINTNIDTNVDLPQQISEIEQKFKDKEAIEILNRYFKSPEEYLKEDTLKLLRKPIKQASKEALVNIFKITRAVRKEGKVKSDIAVRNNNLEREKNAVKLKKKTIPIFEILIEINPEYHRYYAQKAYAIKGSILKSSEAENDKNESQHWQETLELLDKAIAKRDISYDRGCYPLYEINRAISRISIDESFKQKEISNIVDQKLIEIDIKYFLRAERDLKINLEDYNKLVKWCHINKKPHLENRLRRLEIV